MTASVAALAWGAIAPVPGGIRGSAAGAAGTGKTTNALAPSKPNRVCGNSTLLSGPTAPPPGAVTVPAGDDHSLTLSSPHTTYWFAPGVHTLGPGKFSQIFPKDGDDYIGAPGAILSGAKVNVYAFGQHATDVTIEYLTIKNFGTVHGGNATQGVVNHTSAERWTIEHNTVEHDAGAGVMLGSGDVLTGNCLTGNSQYGFSAYSSHGVTNLTVTGNEVAGNATFDWDAAHPGCGCSGGAKFWATVGAVVTGNYVHDNHNVGLWVDTNNSGFEMSKNYIAHNDAEGIMYEISYNAVISDNTLVDNGWADGAKPTLGFPEPAIYISESGADARVPGPFSGEFKITHNSFVNNWGGVVLWENANRFCGNGSTNTCTLVDPTVYTASSCSEHLRDTNPRATPDYFDNCRWKTQGVTVAHNTFTFAPKAIGPNCKLKTRCGFNGLFSEYGSTAPYKAWVVPNDISNHQHNTFTANSYRGPWRFYGFGQGTLMTWTQWTKGVPDAGGSGDSFQGQDAGSTYHRSGG